MPSLNNPYGNQAKDPKTKLMVMIGLGLALFIFIGFLITSRSDKPETNSPKPNSYYDSRSGETVSDPAGKTPDRYGVVDGEPIYLGFSKLLDYGVTTSQLEGVKTGFYSYSQVNKLGIDEVSIDVASIKAGDYDPTVDTKQTLTFNVQFDRKTKYDAQVDYSGLHIVRLYLRSGNKQIYDSGDMDFNPNPGE